MAYARAEYGGATDTWGASGWTPAQVNAAGFGIAITPQPGSADGSVQVYIDSVTVTVHYRGECP